MRFPVLVSFVALAILSACSGETQDVSGNDTILLDDASESNGVILFEPLITGAQRSDNLRYWNCSEITSDGDTQENIHVRFWRDGLGFIGSEDMSWSANTSDSVSMHTDNGVVSLSNFIFHSDHFESDRFTATNSAGGTLSCNLKGPVRDQIFLDFTGSTTGGALLNSQLINSDSQQWSCTEISVNGSTQSVNYRLAGDQSAFIGESEGTWFIDDRFNLIISLGNSVHVIQDIFMTSDSSQFTARSFGSNLNCSKTSI